MTEQQIQTKKIKELEADGYYVLKLIKNNLIVMVYSEKNITSF